MAYIETPSKYLISLVPGTGQTGFYSDQSKNPDEFPTNYRKDSFMEYCLDAPCDIPNGRIYYHGKSSFGFKIITVEARHRGGLY